MRIVAGKHRSRILQAPQSELIRPTSDKVRQAIFNALNSRGAVVDTVVLDLFCGTGALGLEALSQGAAQAIFVDDNPNSLTLSKANAALLKETENCVFILQDATKLSKKPAAQTLASLCFIDPPYHENLIALALPQLKTWLTEDALIVAEMEKDAPPLPEYCQVEFEKTYGDTKVIAFQVTNWA